jgi:hypothetical protein
MPFVMRQKSFATPAVAVLLLLSIAVIDLHKPQP